MADQAAGGRTQTTARLWRVVRLGFVALVAAALACGYVGLRDYLDGSGGEGFGRSGWDLLYYDLQLFVLSSAPLDAGGPYPWTLEFARFAAPAAAVYALFEAAHALLAGQLRRLGRQLARGHAVVTGTGTTALAVAAALRQAGKRVVEVATGDAAALRAAGAARAAYLYACEDERGDSAVNVSAALAAAQLRAGTPLRVFAHVSDAQLGLALRARRLTLPEPDRLHLDFFNVEELAARELVRTDRHEDLADAAYGPQVVVVGAGTFARTVIVELARWWRLHCPEPTRRAAVALVDPGAAATATLLTGCHPVVREVCDLTPVPVPLAEHLRSRSGPPPHRVYLCQEDEQAALSMALGTVDLWHGGPGSVVVRLDRLAHHGGAFHHPDRRLLDDLGGRLRLVGVTELACDPVAISEDLVERLAQAIHEHYLTEQVRNGTPMGASESMRPWYHVPATSPATTGVAALSEDRKRANRDQARHIGHKLDRVGCTVAPRTGTTGSFEFTDPEVELLSELEHERWMSERQAAGWTYHPVRDDQAKRHHSLVSWGDLSEAERDKDRQAVRAIPTVLASAGLQVVRLSPPS